jgi:hypothetical protein
MKVLIFYVAMFSILYLMCLFTLLVAGASFEEIKTISLGFVVSVLICYPFFLKVKKIL